MTPVSPAPAKRAFSLGVVLWLVAGGLLGGLLAPAALAAQPAPVGADGLAGGQWVASAFASPAPGAGLASLEYAYTESVLGTGDSHQRAAGTVGVGYELQRWFAAGLALEGRGDFHASPTDRGLAASTRLATRHALDVGARLALALATLVHFPGADGVARGLRATSPQFSALAAFAPSTRSALALTAGYRVDRSRHALADPFELSAPDRLAAEIAAHDALPVGALLSLRSGEVTWALEWSWDLGIGAGAPSVAQAPMRLGVVAQTPLGQRMLLGGFAGASPGARPSFERLVRIEPRVWAGLTLGFTFGEAAPVEPPASRPAVREAQAAAPRRVRVTLHIVDAAGDPIAQARVSQQRDGAWRGSAADEQGRVTLSGADGETVDILVEAKDFAPRELRVQLTSGAPEHEVTLQSTLPPGEIKGKVRSLRGGPLVARIEVVELGAAVVSQPDGTFRVPVPPGAYTLRITAERHEAQQRSVRVEQLGVAILVIDLRRLAP
jgi:hypothetical protein